MPPHDVRLLVVRDQLLQPRVEGLKNRVERLDFVLSRSPWAGTWVPLVWKNVLWGTSPLGTGLVAIKLFTNCSSPLYRRTRDSKSMLYPVLLNFFKRLDLKFAPLDFGGKFKFFTNTNLYEPLPLRARASLLETSDLYNIEEQSSECIGDLGVDGLQASAEFRVAVAMGSRERRLVADTVNALLRTDRRRAVIVFATTGILGCVLAQIVVGFGDVTGTAPLGTRIHYPTARCLIL